jgi:hypothetical protein
MTAQEVAAIEENLYDFTLEIDMVAPDGSVYMDGIFIDDNKATVAVKGYELSDEPVDPATLPF